MKLNRRGFILIELIVVISIMAILMFISLQWFNDYIGKAKEQVCNSNCNELNRMYDGYLLTEDIVHTEVLFEEFIQEYGKKLCPKKGRIRYESGKVICDIHTKVKEDKDEAEDEVPYL